VREIEALRAALKAVDAVTLSDGAPPSIAYACSGIGK
jgi:hypothetical protein